MVEDSTPCSEVLSLLKPQTPFHLDPRSEASSLQKFPNQEATLKLCHLGVCKDLG